MPRASQFTQHSAGAAADFKKSTRFREKSVRKANDQFVACNEPK